MMALEAVGAETERATIEGAYLKAQIADEVALANLLGYGNISLPATITPNCWIFGTNKGERSLQARLATAPLPRWRRDNSAFELIGRFDLSIITCDRRVAVGAGVGNAATANAVFADHPTADDAIRYAMCKAAIAYLTAERTNSFDAQATEIAAASRKLAEQQAAADARDAPALAADKARLAVALAKQQDAKRREDDHGPALVMNVEFDAARDAERVRLSSLRAQYVADLTEQNSLESLVEAKDGDDDLDPTNDEITAMGADFGMTPAQWVERLDLFVIWRRTHLAVLGE